MFALCFWADTKFAPTENNRSTAKCFKNHSLKAGRPGEADALQEGEEAEGFADAAQGDVEGVVIGGGIEEAVQAGIQECQVLQQDGLVGSGPPGGAGPPGRGPDACGGGRGPRGRGRIARPGCGRAPRPSAPGRSPGGRGGCRWNNVLPYLRSKTGISAGCRMDFRLSREAMAGQNGWDK